MGIGSLFIVNNKTESLCALKHWGPTVAHAPVLDKVFASHRNSVKNNLYSDVITTEGKQYIFHITRGEITYVATTETETEPLMVVEFLTQLHTVLKAYFGEVTENVLQVRGAVPRRHLSPPPAPPSRVKMPLLMAAVFPHDGIRRRGVCVALFFAKTKKQTKSPRHTQAHTPRKK